MARTAISFFQFSSNWQVCAKDCKEVPVESSGPGTGHETKIVKDAKNHCPVPGLRDIVQKEARIK